MAVDAQTGTLWVTLTARNQVARVDLQGRRPEVTANFPTVPQPNTVAVDPATGGIDITGTAAGVLERLSPGTANGAPAPSARVPPAPGPKAGP